MRILRHTSPGWGRRVRRGAARQAHWLTAILGALGSVGLPFQLKSVAAADVAPSAAREKPVRASVAAPPAAPTLPPGAGGPGGPTKTIDIKDIRPGMVGYGLTVFAGTEPERFEAKVIGVLHKFRPGIDIILIRSNDPKLASAGATQGMSGSPLYFDGKLAGAFAYGFPFSKELIAGVTPISAMIAEMRRPRRGMDPVTGMASDSPTPVWGPAAAGGPLADLILDRNGRPTSPLAMLAHPLEEWAALTSHERAFDDTISHAKVAAAAQVELTRLSVPVSLAGFSPPSVAMLKDALGPLGLTAYEGTSGGAPPTPHPKVAFKPGSSISVQLARGDVSMVGTGTVTYVDGENLVAFGHPMFGVGELYLPVATAMVHTFMPSLSVSFKLSSPLDEAGALVQDREPGIVANTKLRATMIPVRVVIHEGNQPVRKFSAEVARHRMLTPMLTSAVIMSALHQAASDLAHAVAHVRSKLTLRGREPIMLQDDVYAADGVGGRGIPAASALRALVDLAVNPFEKVGVDGIDVDVTLAFRPDFAEIVGVRMDATELEPGQRTNVYVTTRPLMGPERVEVIPVELPVDLANQNVRIEVASGQSVRPEMAPPENVTQLIANLKKSYSSRSLIVSLHTPFEGAFISGHVLSDLPASELDTLRPSASSKKGEPYRAVTRIERPLPYVVAGKQELQIHVKPRAQ